MSFPSFTFGVFFALVFAATRLRVSWSARKGVLLAASYVFYGAWNPPFVLLLALSTAVDWTAARRIHHAERLRARRAWLALSLASNLGLLAFFKYGAFAADNLVALLGAAGVDASFAPPSIVLPVGISFYTFQTLSYSIDVYRRRLVPARSLLDYALYVSFFPQLVAGPIVRARTFLPQCEHEHRATGTEVSWGLTLLVVGLFQKVVLADALLAPVVDRVYADAGLATPVDAWVATAAFAGQIFCDFSGYTTCALGTALALGFHLPDNFRAPYAAVGFSDFWRRWHISLSTWLRDYLYIPLGGNRHGQARTALALTVTMLLGGLWHGAAWTFVAWGALHGLYLVAEHLLKSVYGDLPAVQRPDVRLVLGAVTLFFVTLAWVFFRAESFADASALLDAMLGTGGLGAPTLRPWEVATASVVVTGLVLSHVVLRHRTLEDLAGRAPAWLRAAVIGVLLFLLLTSPGTDRAFLYFQF